MWHDLCEDLIVEIFTRLPTKSLLRFRSVSKSLCSCIGSPDFINLQTLRSPKKAIMVHQVFNKAERRLKYLYTLHSEGQLLSSPNVSVTAVEYPFGNFYIVGSCNGILCILGHGNGINLWNPSTRQKLTVEDRPSFEGQSSCNVFGFGFDPIIDDYKILRYTKADTLKVYSVYTLKTDTWCEIGGPTTPYSCLKSCQCLFNGILHWVVAGTDIICLFHIMTFDLSTEVFSAIALPEPGWETTQVTVIKGYLAVISSENYDNIWIWTRKLEENNSNTCCWSVAFKFETTRVKQAHKVLQLTANGDLLFNALLQGVLVYNTETQSLVEWMGSCCVFGMEMYVESLQLLQMGISCDVRAPLKTS